MDSTPRAGLRGRARSFEDRGEISPVFLSSKGASTQRFGSGGVVSPLQQEKKKKNISTPFIRFCPARSLDSDPPGAVPRPSSSASPTSRPESRAPQVHRARRDPPSAALLPPLGSTSPNPPPPSPLRPGPKRPSGARRKYRGRARPRAAAAVSADSDSPLHLRRRRLRRDRRSRLRARLALLAVSE